MRDLAGTHRSECSSCTRHVVFTCIIYCANYGYSILIRALPQSQALYRFSPPLSQLIIQHNHSSKDRSVYWLESD